MSPLYFRFKRLTPMLAGLLLVPLPLVAGDGGKPTVQVGVGTAPRATDPAEVRIQTAVVPVKTDDPKPIAPPPRGAADWVAAWQAAKEMGPADARIKVFYADAPGNAAAVLKTFECREIKARGELLILAVKAAADQEPAVLILRAGDVVRIEIKQPAPAKP
jgi:hypothetical protein